MAKPKKKGIDLENSEFNLGDLTPPKTLIDYLRDPSNSILYELIIGNPKITLDSTDIVGYSVPISFQLRKESEIKELIKQRVLQGFNQRA